jgi:hypothetical protein
MKKNKYSSYSSFWMDKSLFEDGFDGVDSVSAIERKSSDIMKLVSYKRSIANFVSIVTGQSIPVRFEEKGDSYTDGKSVVISAKMDGSDFDSTVGLALHEGSHIKLTDFSTLHRLIRDNYLPSSVDVQYLKQKYGVTEDYQLAGYILDNLKSLLNYVEDRRIDNFVFTTAPGYRGYYQSMYEKYFNAPIIDKGLESSEYRSEDWDSYLFRIINLTNPKRDLTALNGLQEIWNIIDLRNISRLKTSWEALEVAGQILMVIEKNTPAPQPGQSQSSADGDSDESMDGENGQAEMSGNMDETATSPSQGMKGSGAGEAMKSDNDSDGDADGESDSKESGVPTGGSNPHGAGGNLDGLSEKQRQQLRKAIEKQKEFQDGDVKKTKLNKSDAKKVESLDAADIQTEVTGKGMNQGWYGQMKSAGTETYVINNMTKGLIESGLVGMLSNSTWLINRQEETIKKGIALGTLLGKKLKTRNEERSLVTPRMKSGRLSGRMIHEIGFGNFDIFERTMVNQVNPALIHITIDASSSMSGSKWDNTQVAAVAIAKAASMTQNMDVVISYRAIYNNRNGKYQPLVLIAYDSRKDKFSKIQQLFKHITYDGTTPEGLCFEAIMKELVRVKKGTDTYFVNFSDGYPGFDNHDINYCGDTAVNHTAEQVKKIRSYGVNVLSYFISDGYSGSGNDQFRKMYGKDAEFINVTQVSELAKTLNSKFQVNI